MSEANTTLVSADHDASAIAAIAEASDEGTQDRPLDDVIADVVAPPAIQGIPLAAVLLDSNDELVEGSALAGQPVEELLTKTALGGFGPSSAPKKDKPPVELHEYDSPFFRLTGKRALTNNTIDFILTRKASASTTGIDTDTADDLTLAAVMIDAYASNQYLEAVMELPGSPDLKTLDYSLVFNMKPVQAAEKIVRDLKPETPPEGDDASIYAFILMSPNASQADDQLLPVPRSIRINAHAPTMLFYAVSALVKDAFNRGEVGTEAPQATDGDLTMEKIRRAYLKITDNPNAPAKPTQTKKDVKAEKAARTTQAMPAFGDERAAKSLAEEQRQEGLARARAERAESNRDVAERPSRADREQRGEGGQGRASDRMLHRHIEQSSGRHDEMMAQLRINQKQQGQILEGQAAILKDNETLFALMNLLMTALGKPALVK